MVKQASSAALLECVIWLVWNRRCRLTEVSESSTGQQGTLCVNLKKEGRGFILNNHVGIDEGGYYEGFSTPRHWPEAGEEGRREQGEIKNLGRGGADWIIFQGSMLWHKDPYVLSLSLSGEFVCCLWVMGGRGGN